MEDRSAAARTMRVKIAHPTSVYCISVRSTNEEGRTHSGKTQRRA